MSIYNIIYHVVYFLLAHVIRILNGSTNKIHAGRRRYKFDNIPRLCSTEKQI